MLRAHLNTKVRYCRIYTIYFLYIVSIPTLLSNKTEYTYIPTDKYILYILYMWTPYYSIQNICIFPSMDIFCIFCIIGHHNRVYTIYVYSHQCIYSVYSVYWLLYTLYTHYICILTVYCQHCIFSLSLCLCCLYRI